MTWNKQPGIAFDHYRLDASPYFVSKANKPYQARAGQYGYTYAVFGAGMHPSGCAAFIKGFSHLTAAKAHAESL